MCGGYHQTTAVLRYDSFLSADDVVIMLIYEVQTIIPFLLGRNWCMVGVQQAVHQTKTANASSM